MACNAGCSRIGRDAASSRTRPGRPGHRPVVTHHDVNAWTAPLDDSSHRAAFRSEGVWNASPPGAEPLATDRRGHSCIIDQVAASSQQSFSRSGHSTFCEVAFLRCKRAECDFLDHEAVSELPFHPPFETGSDTDWAPHADRVTRETRQGSRFSPQRTLSAPSSRGGGVGPSRISQYRPVAAGAARAARGAGGCRLPRWLANPLAPW